MILSFYPMNTENRSKTFRRFLFGIAILVGFGEAGLAGPIESTHRDVEYARTSSPEVTLTLDLYLPGEIEKPSLVVWVHGGAWRSGSKERMPVGGLVEKGFAIASVNYRLSPVAKFPAQIHDIKAAIRFLRAMETEYGYDSSRIAILGASAGGHLAALVGVTNDHEDLEGEVGEHDDVPSTVHAIVDFYGPTNFLTILKQSTPHGLGVRIPALQLLLRAQPETVPDLARLASPVFHVDAADPPLLLIHGDQDPQVPINQSHELQGAYKEAELADRVTFEVIHGGAHGGDRFYDDERIKLVAEFLHNALDENIAD